jgi:hypothetical protein
MAHICRAHDMKYKKTPPLAEAKDGVRQDKGRPIWPLYQAPGGLWRWVVDSGVSR